jgi:hypothetical protein
LLATSTLPKIKRNQPFQVHTTAALGGFHGAVSLILYNSNGKEIGFTEPARFGVDGYLIGISDRTDRWTRNIDPPVAKQVTYVQVVHSWSPDSLKTILTKCLNAATTIAGVPVSLGVPGVGTGVVATLGALK